MEAARSGWDENRSTTAAKVGPSRDAGRTLPISPSFRDVAQNAYRASLRSAAWARTGAATGRGCRRDEAIPCG